MSGITRRLREEDEGISLVEVMVGLVIILTSLIAFASTLTRSLTAVSQDEQFVRGTQLAADIIERDRGYAFDCQGDATCINVEGELGFYADDPGYQNVASDGSYTVTLGATRPSNGGAPVPGPVPSESITRDGVTYEVTREVVWIDDPTQPGTENYKEIRVALAWEAANRTYRTDTSTARYDRPDPIEECTPGEIVAFDVAPDFVRISPSGLTLQDITIAVETCTSTDWATLTPIPLSDRSMVEQSGSDGTKWRVDPIAAGATEFDPGTYTWTVEISNGTTAQTDIVFVEDDTAVLAVHDLVVAPPGVMCVDPSGVLYSDTAVEATITGGDEDDAVSFAWTAQDGSTTATYGGLDDNSRAKFNGTVPAGHVFTAATTTLTVSVTRSTDSLNVTENFTVDVVEAATQAECPT